MVKFPLSRHRRAVWSRSIRGFWLEYRSNKIGLLGLIMVMIYLIVGVFAPWLTIYDPTKDISLAENFALPAWMTIFPGYENLPRTMQLKLSWDVMEAPEAFDVIETGDNLIVQHSGTTMQTASFTSTFVYPYDPPTKFRISFTWLTEEIVDTIYAVELYITNQAGNEFILWTTYSTPAVKYLSINQKLTNQWIWSTSLQTHVRQELGLDIGESLAKDLIFTEVGEYKFKLKITSKSLTDNGLVKLHFKSTSLKIPGLVHGILGTDFVGADVFSQLIYGSQISLAVGLSSAGIATSIGILVGIISGYIGGFVDEGIMRIVDVLLALPVMPLLLGLISVFGTSIWYLVLLIAVFGWLGLSRLIRSSVLSLKEMPFIECARAAGASHFYIMRKHILPNVIPVALAALVLSVPAAILTEAGISFIGLGDPGAPTWGRMLHHAFTAGAFWQLAWWWIIPPGAAITILTLSFVFIGHAVDEIVNPRLRRRR